MTRNELVLLSMLMALNVQLAATELVFGEIPTGEMPDEVRNEVVAYKKRTKELNEKLHAYISAKFESFLIEEK